MQAILEKSGHEPAEEQVSALERELLGFFGLLRRFKHLTARRDELKLDQHTFMLLDSVHERGPLRVQELAGSLGLDASTVSRHVTALQRSGLLVREPDPEDGRARRVRLTAEGFEAWSADRAARRAVVRTVLASWPAEDRERLTHLLNQLNGELTGLMSADLDQTDLNQSAEKIEPPEER